MQNKISVVSSHKKKTKQTNGTGGSGWQTTDEGGKRTKVSMETIHGEIYKSKDLEMQIYYELVGRYVKSFSFHSLSTTVRVGNNPESH